jgi:hypothetical protein
MGKLGLYFEVPMDKPAPFDSDALLRFLSEKWKGTNCPMCKVGDWLVQDDLFELRQFQRGALMIGGPVIPVVPVGCSNCGHTVLVNAITAGALKPEPQIETKPDEKVGAKS